MHLGFADFFRAAIFAAAHVFGGSLGAGIVAVSLGVRLTLLPLTIRLARRTLAQEAILARLQPELQRLQERYRNEPAVRLQRTQALYQREGVRLFDPAAVLGGLVQVPVLAGVYAAVRQGLGAAASFLWISNLFRPDLLLAIGVALLSGLVTYVGARAGQAGRGAGPTAAVWLSASFVLVAAWRASAALVLSWGAGTLGTFVQGLLLRRTRHGSRGARIA
jgi:YidC/Oxa1 family membrane protein insertase